MDVFYEYIIKIVGSHAITEEQEKEENQAKSSQDNSEHKILMTKIESHYQKTAKNWGNLFWVIIYFAPSWKEWLEKNYGYYMWCHIKYIAVCKTHPIKLFG